MPKFVKKIGKVKYYEIDGLRAAGILPYFIKDDKMYILINTENRNNKIVYNCLGGKVDFNDTSIKETMKREFNEETGYLMSDLIRRVDINFKDCIRLIKSKYLLYLYKVKFNNTWNFLPHNYKNIFSNVEFFNHRESINLKWVSLFDFNEKNQSFLLKCLLTKVKKKFHFIEDPIVVDE